MTTRERALSLVRRLKEDAEAAGCHLNPDDEWTLRLAEGLVTNEERYGYRSCPCRLASGVKAKDLDIICPCDYRDPDVDEFGACYCALYVSADVAAGEQEVSLVPERRPANRPARRASAGAAAGDIKLWRCPVCGYLCARSHPPGVCPICKVGKERFEVFDLALLIGNRAEAPSADNVSLS